MGQPGAWGGGGRAGKTAALVPAMGLADEQVCSVWGEWCCVARAEGRNVCVLCADCVVPCPLPPPPTATQVRVLLPTNSTLEYTVQPTGQADANIAGTQPTNTLFGIVFKVRPACACVCSPGWCQA